MPRHLPLQDNQVHVMIRSIHHGVECIVDIYEDAVLGVLQQVTTAKVAAEAAALNGVQQAFPKETPSNLVRDRRAT